MEFQIRSIPTLMIVRDGVAVFSQPGMMREQQLESLIKQVRELDMDEVRTQIAEHTADQHGEPRPRDRAAEAAEARRHQGGDRKTEVREGRVGEGPRRPSRPGSRSVRTRSRKRSKRSLRFVRTRVRMHGCDGTT